MYLFQIFIGSDGTSKSISLCLRNLCWTKPGMANVLFFFLWVYSLPLRKNSPIWSDTEWQKKIIHLFSRHIRIPSGTQQDTLSYKAWLVLLLEFRIVGKCNIIWTRDWHENYDKCFTSLPLTSLIITCHYFWCWCTISLVAFGCCYITQFFRLLRPVCL